MFVAETRLHYRCVFDLRANASEDPFRAGLQALQRWVERREPQAGRSAFHREWFFKGGQWARPGGGASVETVCETPGEKGRTSWAFRYEHVDHAHPMRFWRTEVGLEYLDDRGMRVAIRLGFGVRDGYVGTEPEEPTPSCPGVVKELIRLNGFAATIGPTQLTTAGQSLTPGRGNLFVSLLGNRQRVVPVALIGLNEDGVPAIDARKLAGVTAGALDTWVVGSPDVREELSHLMPRSLGCGPGMVRLYQARVEFDSAERDSRRHRFFSALQIHQSSEDGVIEQLAAAVTRRFPLSVAVAVIRPEDVHARNRTVEIRARLSREALSDGDWRGLLEAELDRLAPFESRAGDLERQLHQLQDQIDSMEYEIRTAESRALEAEQLNRDLLKAKKDLECLNLPTSIEEIIDWVQALFPGRLVFTPEARASARDASINKRPKDFPDIFEVLKSMATDLHDIFFLEGSRDPVAAYKNATSFELTLTEGKTTKKDSGLMRLRRLQYQGKTLDISPHVKFGNDKNFALRVHFAVDNEARKLVVGHCGDHLDTAGTRRM